LRGNNWRNLLNAKGSGILHAPWAQEVPGSNPGIPTKIANLNTVVDGIVDKKEIQQCPSPPNSISGNAIPFTISVIMMRMANGVGFHQKHIIKEIHLIELNLKTSFVPKYSPDSTPPAYPI